MNRKPVVIRTADIGNDKYLADINTKTNSSLNDLRGIKYSLAQKDQFKKQLRAIVRASEFGNVKITFPMVTSVEDILKSKELLDIVYYELGGYNAIQGELNRDRSL